MASTGLKSSSKVLKEFAIKKRTQLWQYLNTSVDFFLRSVGLRTTDELIAGDTLTVPASLSPVPNKVFVQGGVTYNTYRFTSWFTLTAADTNVAIVSLGIIQVSEGLMFIINNKCNVAADETASIGGYSNTTLSNDGTTVEVSGGATTAKLDGATDFAYINQDNNVGGAPVSDNFMFAIIEGPSIAPSTFQETEVYVELEFITEATADVVLTRI